MTLDRDSRHHAFVDMVAKNLDEMTELEDPMGALVSERLLTGEFDEYVEDFEEGSADEAAASALIDFLIDLVHWNPEPVPNGNHVLRSPRKEKTA